MLLLLSLACLCFAGYYVDACADVCVSDRNGTSTHLTRYGYPLL